MILTCHGDCRCTAQFPTADERGRQFVRVLQSAQCSSCPREIICVRKPILVVGDVGHQCCEGEKKEGGHGRTYFVAFTAAPHESRPARNT